MGYATTQRAWLVQTVRVVEVALHHHGHAYSDGVNALEATLAE